MDAVTLFETIVMKKHTDEEIQKLLTNCDASVRQAFSENNGQVILDSFQGTGKLANITDIVAI